MSDYQTQVSALRRQGTDISANDINDRDLGEDYLRDLGLQKQQTIPRVSRIDELRGDLADPFIPKHTLTLKPQSKKIMTL